MDSLLLKSSITPIHNDHDVKADKEVIEIQLFPHARQKKLKKEHPH
jgi:hypothetical protein